MIDDSKRVRPVADQPIHVFDFPKSLTDADPHLPASFGLIELNAKQLVTVRNRCKNDMSKLNDETLKESVVEIGDAPVSPGRHEVEAFFDNMKQKALQFFTAAYHQVNMITDEEIGDALKNFRVKA